MKTLNVVVPSEIVTAYISNVVSWGEVFHLAECQFADKKVNVHFGDELEASLYAILATKSKAPATDVDSAEESTDCKKIEAMKIDVSAESGDITLAINPRFIIETINITTPLRDAVNAIAKGVIGYKNNIKRFNAKWR